MFLLFYPYRGSSLSFMRTGERHWLARAAQCFVFWTLRVTTSLCWKECLKISHLDRLVQQFVLWCMVVVLCTSSMLIALLLLFLLCPSVTLSLSLQAFWAPGDTGVVFVGWAHEPFRLGLKYCPNRRWLLSQWSKSRIKAGLSEMSLVSLTG